jgi:hypothetical protein
MLFRKVFYFAFIENYDSKDYPTEIDLPSLTKGNHVSISDLTLFKKVLSAEVKSLELKDLERLDKLVDDLAFDRERDIYFNNSRMALSLTNQ